MESLQIILQDAEEKLEAPHLYSVLAIIQLNDEDRKTFYNKIIPILYKYCESGVLNRALLYLSLVANDTEEALKEYVKYESNQVSVDLSKACTLFEIVHFKRKDWLLQVIEDDIYFNEQHFSTDIFNNLKFIKLLYTTNEPNVDFQYASKLISDIDVDENSFMKVYIAEIDQLITLQNFVSMLAKEDQSDIVYRKTIDRVSFFEILSESIDLKDEMYYCSIEKILSLRTKHLKDIYGITDSPRLGYSEINNFQAFVIIKNVLECLELEKLRNTEDPPNHIEDRMQLIYDQVIAIKNPKLQLEVLENIFTLMFLKEQHLDENLTPNEEDVSEFYCKKGSMLLLIILFLQVLVDDLSNTEVFQNEGQFKERFLKLQEIVSNARWKFEMIYDQNEQKFNSTKSIMHYMLANPSGLLTIALKRNNFETARQIIQRYKIQNSGQSREVACEEKLQNFRKKFMINIVEPPHNFNPLNEMKILFESNNNFHNEFREELLRELLCEHKFLEDYLSKNYNFINSLDLAIVCGRTNENSRSLLKAAETFYRMDKNSQSPLSKFYGRLKNLVNTFEDKSIAEILLDPNINFDVDVYLKEKSLLDTLGNKIDIFDKSLLNTEAGGFNTEHESHKFFLEIEDKCVEFCKSRYGIETKKEYRYFTKVLNYLKVYSSVFQNFGNHIYSVSGGKDISYFALLETKRSTIIRHLVFEDNVCPFEIEKIYRKLKLHLSQDIAANCFPHLVLPAMSAMNHSCDEEELIAPNKQIVSYVNKRHWLLGYILCEIYETENSLVKTGDGRVLFLENFAKTDFVSTLMKVYSQNKMMTIICYGHFVNKVINYCREKIGDSLPNTNLDLDVIEPAEEVSDDLKVVDWLHYYNILECVPEYYFKTNGEVKELRDKILVQIVTDKMQPNYYTFVRYIRDNDLRAKTVLSEMKFWPIEFCIEAIDAELSHYCADENRKEVLNNWLLKLNFNKELTTTFMNLSWYELHRLCKTDPYFTFQGILGASDLHLLMNYIKLYNPDRAVRSSVTEEYVEKLFSLGYKFDEIEALFAKLPIDHTTKLIHSLIKQIKSLSQLQFLIQYLINNTVDRKLEQETLKISYKILSLLHSAEREQMQQLVGEPLLMMEMLIMNTRLDKLGEVIKSLNPDADKDANRDHEMDIIETEKVDALLRRYAEKSLDFRVVIHRKAQTAESGEFRMLQSYDTDLSFNLPQRVPKREDWIADTKVAQCMCCRSTVFSMFNRRHHCRRCGRVVCHNCSAKKLQIETYGHLPVRVCSDCYRLIRTDGSTSTTSDSSKSNTYDSWTLTNDQTENEIIRAEFSFEQAPSVSLCLSILKYHSKTEEVPKFLIKHCAKLFQLVKPVHKEEAHDFDYLLILRMLKSLAVAAKIQCMECDYLGGINEVEKILQQADLYMLLSEKGLLGLLAQWKVDFIDSTVLRKIRDKLIEDEEWHFALDITTKSGLDPASVFGAWGKSCLKAGNLKLAKEKFALCFERGKTRRDTLSKPLQSSTLSTSSLNLPSTSRNSPRKDSTMNGKPIRNPPLLKEIVSILESLSSTVLNEQIIEAIKVKSESFPEASGKVVNNTIDTPIVILSKLKNLKAIANGQYINLPKDVSRKAPDGDSRPVKSFIETIFYQECLYYLDTYGSHTSLVKFYFKHGDFLKGLQYIIDNEISSSVFADVYYASLKEGTIHILHEYLAKIDNTLLVWKNHIEHLIGVFHKKRHFNCLYQLQVFMGDYIRACMTCLRFYTENMTTFAVQKSRSKFLDDAEDHLKKALGINNGTGQEKQEIKPNTDKSLLLSLTQKQVEQCLLSVARQKEAVEYLSHFEDDRPILEVLPNIVSYGEEQYNNENTIPTLFDTLLGKIQLAVLVLVCGIDMNENFEKGDKIIKDCNLKVNKVYCQAAKILIQEKRISHVCQMVKNIKGRYPKSQQTNDACDEVLVTACRQCRTEGFEPKDVDPLIKLIVDKTTIVSVYLENGSIKCAYLFALRYGRYNDIRRIMVEADKLNKTSIKNLCVKALAAYEETVEKSPKKQ